MNPQIHPIAELWPPMTDEEYRELAEDIKANGLKFSIVLFEGMILDGRHRYRACLETATAPHFSEYTGTDPIGYTVSVNGIRRNLTASQKAITIAQLVERRGLQWGEGRAKAESEAAEAGGVSRTLVGMARKLLNTGHQNLVDEVASGQTAIHTALKKAEQLGKPEPAEPEDEFERASLLDRLEKSCGKVFRKAVDDNVIKLRNQDLIYLLNIPFDWRRQELTRILVERPTWSIEHCERFTWREIKPDSKIEQLVLFAIAKQGKVLSYEFGGVIVEALCKKPGKK